MRIGITGATGFIGSHLVEELLHRGHEVRCLTRPSSNLRWLRRLDAELFLASAFSPDEMGGFVRGIDAMVHTAGSKFAATPQEFRKSNEVLTTALLDAVERHNPEIRRFVYLSSMAVTGPSADGRPIAEDEPPRPLSSYGESKLRTELIVSRYAGVPSTIVRPPGVYGPRDSDILPVFQMVQRGVLLVTGRRNTLDLVYVKNLVHAVALMLESTAAANRTYHVADGHPYTWEGLGVHLGAYLGRSPLTVAVPGPLLSAVGWAGQRAARWAGTEAKLNSQKAREMRSPHWRVSWERARVDLGYQPPYAVEQAVAETFDWYRAHRWL